MSTPTEVIEHVVLFNVSDDQDPTKVNDWVDGLTSLSSLPEVLFLTAGPILRPRTFPSDLHFTHILFSRYPSLNHLHSYSGHPDHIRVVTELGQPITSDILACDWTWPNQTLPKSPLPGRALRFNFLRLTPASGESKKGEILEGFKRVKEICDGMFEEMSYGEEVSIGRAKGFGVAVVAVFQDLNELDACEEYEDSVREVVDKFKSVIDGVISVDYVVPRHGPVTDV